MTFVGLESDGDELPATKPASRPGARLLALALGLAIGALICWWVLPGRLERPPVVDADELQAYLAQFSGSSAPGGPDGPAFVLQPSLDRSPWLVTSSLGLRSPELDPAKRRPRIMILGDSFTFGFGLAEGEPYPAVLEARLGGAADVVNCGVSGYEFRDTLALFERLVDRVLPDVVVVTFVANDLDDSRVFVDVGVGFTRYPELAELGPEGRFISTQNVQRLAQLELLNGEERAAFVHRHAQQSEFLTLGLGPSARRRWMEYRRCLARIQEGARRHGASVVLYSFLVPAAPANAPLFTQCDALGIPLFSIPANLNLGDAKYRLEWDPHPNALAHALFAERLLGVLATVGRIEVPDDVEPLEPIRLDDDLALGWMRGVGGYAHGRLTPDVVLQPEDEREDLHQILGGFEDASGLLGGPAIVVLTTSQPPTQLVLEAVCESASSDPRRLEIRIAGVEQATVLDVTSAPSELVVPIPPQGSEPIPMAPQHHLVEIELSDPLVLAAPPADRRAKAAIRIRRITLR